MGEPAQKNKTLDQIPTPLYPLNIRYMDKHYAIIDIETTGGSPQRDRITEIAIIIHDGQRILDSYETLIDPQCSIPYHITRLTGISNDTVAGAPKFYEVAKEIVQRTEGKIFVAHNVRFDYGFIREEFARLGYTYTRPQLCTVRLSRKSLPGYRSYSLGNLVQDLGIQIKNRHRAMGDAMATAELFKLVMSKSETVEDAQSMVNLGIKESRLPKNMTLEKLHALPEACGVYYFHNEAGEVVYIGKSINVRKRVAEHFADQTEKAAKLQKMVHDISVEATGSELVALLLESYEIKRLRPPVNKAQRQQHFPYCVHAFYNAAGYLCFEPAQADASARKSLKIISEYPKMSSARGRLQGVLERHELCARFCHLQQGESACFNFHIKQCKGACAGVESAEEYNARALAAMADLNTVFDKDFYLVVDGRMPGEKGVVRVQGGSYVGFGYLDAEGQYGLEDLAQVIKPYPGNPETNRFVQRFMSEMPGVKIIYG